VAGVTTPDPDQRGHAVTVHLVRHGQSTWNVEGRLQGQTPHPGLTDLGRAQARAAGDRLAALVPTSAPDEVALWSSDLTRARQSAELVADRLGLPHSHIRIDPALREQALGDLEGALTSDLDADPVPPPPGKHLADIRWGGPASESVRDVDARIAAYLARALPTAPAHLILLTHGDTLRILHARLTGRSYRDLDWDLPIPNGAVVTVNSVEPPAHPR